MESAHRLERPKVPKRKVAIYKEKAEWRAVLKVAAQQWSEGVPWHDALRIAGHAAAQASKVKGKRGRT